jgi:hypothetical protein
MNGDIGKKIIQSYKADFHLFDAYRHKFPTGTRTTWSNADRSVESRLDRFYLSRSFLPSLTDVSIFPASLSDHAVVQVTVSLTGSRSTRPEYWKCNVSVLDDPDLVIHAEALCRITERHLTKKQRMVGNLQ